MKTPLLFAALLALPVVLMAEAAPAGLLRHPFQKFSRQRAVEKFDADKDGKLSAAERETAKSALKEKVSARHEKRFDRLDADHNGEISRAEWDALPARHQARAGAFRQRLVEKFDADKDGQLSPAERHQAREALREWFLK